MKNCWYNGLELFEMIDKLTNIEDWQKDILKMEIESMNYKGLPSDGTNGDMMGAVFPKVLKIHKENMRLRLVTFPDGWWDEPYSWEQEEEED